MNRLKKIWWLLLLATATLNLNGCTEVLDRLDVNSFSNDQSAAVQTNQTELPTEYDGSYQEIIINDNVPTFKQEELSFDNGVWQTFSDLDSFNRVGVANTLIGKESFPTEARAPLAVKPTGWRQKKLSDGQWLYNRCHLIGFQLTGENDNMKNLMTGTRQFNTPHMLNYENQIMDYIRLTGNHVRYRVTPHFIGDELVARGVQMEAASVEADDFAYNVYIFNVQDGYSIDYKTGKATKV